MQTNIQSMPILCFVVHGGIINTLGGPELDNNGGDSEYIKMTHDP